VSSTSIADDEDDDPLEADKDRPPLLEAAMDLLRDLHMIFRDIGPQFAPSLHTLFQGAGDAMGGLAQGLARREREEDGSEIYGLRVTQLKRALRGAAFASGALFPLRPAITAEQFDELHRRLRSLEQDIFHEIGRVRAENQD
jgi:hypothetical protein